MFKPFLGGCGYGKVTFGMYRATFEVMTWILLFEELEVAPIAPLYRPKIINGGSLDPGRVSVHL